MLISLQNWHSQTWRNRIEAEPIRPKSDKKSCPSSAQTRQEKRENSTQEGVHMKDFISKKEMVIELVRSMSPEQRQQLLTEDFKAEFEKEVTAEIDRRIKANQGEGAADPDGADQGK